jgi:hypothetical protein
MDGIILFADDEVFNSTSFENKFFNQIRKSEFYPILPINNLDHFVKTIKSASTFKAILLDWEFNDEIDPDEGISNKSNPLETLLSNNIYSLIFIYSHANIGEESKEQLRAKYGNKIQFIDKIKKEEDIQSEVDKIVNAITDFNTNNSHLKVPFIWSQAINQSSQAIFSELEQADPNWVKEIYDTAKSDGADSNTEVISVFQSLLSEQIIQNSQLLKEINDLAALPPVAVTSKEESLAKLYNRMYYTKVEFDAPIMTGDIFNIDDNTSAILITPECDVFGKCTLGLDLLLINKSGFSDYLSKTWQISPGSSPTIKQKPKIENLFNQDEIKIHVLPSFPFDTKNYKSTALIDFQSSYVNLKKTNLLDGDGKLKRNYKLNSPYIHQLRQRYLSYNGRVGVPKIPQSLREYNLK